MRGKGVCVCWGWVVGGGWGRTRNLPLWELPTVLPILSWPTQCYGYVQFERDEDAQTAIDKVNGMLVGGKPVTVQRYVRRTERKGYVQSPV